MTAQAGVKTVVVGGRPTTGPMQRASGSRGARIYSSEALDYDFINVNDTLKDYDAFAKLPQRDNNDLWINFAGFNIRDQIRQGDSEAIPAQFKYDAADCRLYYTLANIYNLTQLWTDVATAAWDDPSLCVADSTGYSTRNASAETKPPPKRTTQAPDLNLDHITFSDLVSNISSTPSLYDVFQRTSISTTNLKQCFDTVTSKGCTGATHCRAFDVDCTNTGTFFRPMAACLPDTTNFAGACGDNMYFTPTVDAFSKRNVPQKNGKTVDYEPVIVTNGYCVPYYVDVAKYNIGCPRV